jgi:hypothetical protein
MFPLLLSLDFHASGYNPAIQGLRKPTFLGHQKGFQNVAELLFASSCTGLKRRRILQSTDRVSVAEPQGGKSHGATSYFSVRVPSDGADLVRRQKE